MNDLQIQTIIEKNLDHYPKTMGPDSFYKIDFGDVSIQFELFSN